MTITTSYQIVPIYPEPKFSVQAFFIMMACIMVLSGSAFTLIHYLPYFKKELLNNRDQNAFTIEEVQNPNQSDTGKSSGSPDVAYSVTAPAQLHKTPSGSNDSPGADMGATFKKISRGDFLFCLVLITWGFGIMFGLMPGTQSYSALPYGNRAYNLSLRLGLAVNPIVSFLALFVYTKSKVWISVLCAFGTVATIYQFVLACYSPYPPLKGTAEGEVLVSILSIKQNYKE